MQKKDLDDVVAWVRNYFDEQPHAKGAVIGLSGGKDSAVCAGILVRALGRSRVIGVSLPNGEQPDISDAKLIAKELGIRYVVVNINAAYSRLHDRIEDAIITDVTDNMSRMASINMLPRLRMTVLYAISAQYHYRVCGTGNMSEDYVGYATKWGDLACDFNPIQYFTTDEVVALGDALCLPEQVIHKVPSDGICGLSDEDQMGVSYADINKVIRGQGAIDRDVYIKILEMHEYNKHKMLPVPCFKPDWVDVNL